MQKAAVEQDQDNKDRNILKGKKGFLLGWSLFLSTALHLLIIFSFSFPGFNSASPSFLTPIELEVHSPLKSSAPSLKPPKEKKTPSLHTHAIQSQKVLPAPAEPSLNQAASAVASLSDNRNLLDESTSENQDPHQGSTKDRLPTYEERVAQMLNARKRYPTQARRMREEGVVVIQFIVESTGSPSQIELISSSQSQSLDGEALRLIQITQFDTPPRGQRRKLKVSLDFSLD